MPSVDLIHAVVELRALVGLGAHRSDHRADALELEQQRFLAARRFMWTADLLMPLGDIVCEVHARVMGSRRMVGFRSVNVQTRAQQPGAPAYPNKTPFADVPVRLGEVDSRIFRNAELSAFDRAVLTYFEILNIHPFEDGNGRVARVVVSRLLGDIFAHGYAVDVTSVSRSALGPGYELLKPGRAADSYGAWIAYMRGLYAAETQALMRLEVAVNGLSADETGALSDSVSRCIEAIEQGHTFPLLDSDLAVRSPASARILGSFMRPIRSH